MSPKTKTDRKQLTIRLPEKLGKRLKQAAEKFYRPQATIIYEAVDKFLRENRL